MNFKQGVDDDMMCGMDGVSPLLHGVCLGSVTDGAPDLDSLRAQEVTSPYPPPPPPPPPPPR